MKLSLVERETILLYNQAEPMAEVYTHDPRLMEKLELLAKSTPTRSPERTPITLPSLSGVYQSGSHTAPSVAKLPVSVRRIPAPCEKVQQLKAHGRECI